MGRCSKHAFRDVREAKAVELDGVLTFVEVVDDVGPVVAAEDERVRAAGGGAVRVSEVAPHMIVGIGAADETVIPALGAVVHDDSIAEEIVLSGIRPSVRVSSPPLEEVMSRASPVSTLKRQFVPPARRSSPLQ